MPIGTFGFPMPQAFSGGADFSPLANLGNVYQQGQDRQRMLATLAQMGNDPTQNAMLMIKSQNPEMVQHGLTLMNQITEQKRYADAAAERQREFGITSKREQEAADFERQKFDIQQQQEKYAGPIQPGTKKDPVSGEDVPTYYQRDQKSGEWKEVRPPPGGSLTSPEELAAQKSQKNLDEIRKHEDVVVASQKTIEAADRAENIAKASIHWGGLSGPVSAMWQHVPEGTPGKEAAVNTRMLANDALQNMIGQVRGTFGGRSSTKQDQWLKDAQAAPDQSLDFQLGVIDRGRALAKENQWIASQTSEDLKTGKFYKPGYVNPALRVPDEFKAPTGPVLGRSKEAAASAPAASAPAASAPAAGTQPPQPAPGGGLPMPHALASGETYLRAPSDRETNMAKAALAQGKDPKAVRQRMIETGIDPGGIGQ